MSGSLNPGRLVRVAILTGLLVLSGFTLWLSKAQNNLVSVLTDSSGEASLYFLCGPIPGPFTVEASISDQDGDGLPETMIITGYCEGLGPPTDFRMARVQ